MCQAHALCICGKFAELLQLASQTASDTVLASPCMQQSTVIVMWPELMTVSNKILHPGLPLSSSNICVIPLQADE